jgi:hypothetical protein
MNIKEKILSIEEEFITFKAKSERKYLLYLFLYFSPPILAFLLIGRFNPDLSENFIFKLVIFGILLLGLIFHFILRNTYYKSNAGYMKFISDKFEPVKSEFSDIEDFRKNVIESAKEIFTMKNKTLTNDLVKKDIFWNIVFILIGIETEIGI